MTCNSKLLRCCSELCLLCLHVFHCQAGMLDFCSLELNITVCGYLGEHIPSQHASVFR
uniref:Uncharacterized protein n=1 Tax=Arundo donax TaxID=35708 RepID=A0A0A8XSW7_ARUDO